MAWLPRWVSTRGLFAGETPHGTLNGIPSYLGGNLVVASPYLSGGAGYYEDFFTHELEKTWEGAYGSNAESMIRYAQQHGTTDGILLAEFTVKNPPNAAYYKQTITFYGEVYYQNMQDEHSNIDHIECSVNKMCRLEYTNPSSTPIITHTWLYRPFACPNAYILHTGDPTDMRLWFYNKMRCGFGFLTYSDDEYFGAFLYAELDSFYEDNPLKGNQGCILAVKCSELSEAFGIDFDEEDNPLPDEIDDPNEEEPPESGPGKGGSGGGEGDHVLPDEPVLIPPLPVLGSSSVSWLTTYMMTLEDINEFGEELVQPNPMQMLKQYFVDPLDAVVNITLCPAIPTGPRYQKTPIIHASPTDYEWSRSFTACGQYGTVNCGFIDIPPYWDSAFDFDPFTQIHIFLPFIGYRALNADEVMGAKIGVVYHVDVVTGDCTAFVTKNAPSESIYGPMPEQVIGQYNGNCGVSVPIGRVSHDAFVGSMMNLMTVGASVAVGGVVGGEMGMGNVSEAQLASQLTKSGMDACSGSKSKIERSGALGGNCGYMGVRKPYIIRNIARQDLPDNYKDLNGYPCNKGGTLGQYSGTGLAVVESIQLNNIPAMEEERKEILEWLKGGVLI